MEDHIITFMKLKVTGSNPVLATIFMGTSVNLFGFEDTPNSNKLQILICMVPWTNRESHHPFKVERCEFEPRRHLQASHIREALFLGKSENLIFIEIRDIIVV